MESFIFMFAKYYSIIEIKPNSKLELTDLGKLYNVRSGTIHFANYMQYGLKNEIKGLVLEREDPEECYFYALIRSNEPLVVQWEHIDAITDAVIEGLRQNKRFYTTTCILENGDLSDYSRIVHRVLLASPVLSTLGTLQGRVRVFSSFTSRPEKLKEFYSLFTT